MAPGKTPEKVALKDYQDSIKAVADLNDQIEELRHQLSGLIDDRDDAALTLSALQYEGAERDSRHLRAGQLGI